MNISINDVSGWTRMGMRKSFGHIMERLAEENEDFVVLAADVASSAGLSEFASKYPNHFYNIGIAEQNMIAIAAGLAKEGHNVFVVSFAPFAAMRAYEAIRSLVGYMKLNVKVVALSSGVSLGPQGNTHYCFEDIAIMNVIPNMLILSPADCWEEVKCLEYLANYEGPAYLRLTGIDGTPSIFKEDFVFNSSKMIELRPGEDVAIIATGSVVNECVRAARALKKDDISVGVYNIHSLKPFDSKGILNLCDKYKMIVTVEEHSIIGGLGAIVANQLINVQNHPKLLKIGIEDEFVRAGEYTYLMNKIGLSAPNLRDTINKQYKLIKGEQ